MPASNSRASLDRALATRGEDAVLSRRIGTTGKNVDLPVKVHFRGYRAHEIGGGILQGDSVAILSPSQILAAGAAWPGAAGGPQMPRNLDQLTVQGRLRTVQTAAAVYEGGEPVRIELQVRG